MIKQRGGKYYVVVKYRDELGKRHEKWIDVGTNKREAEKKERSILTDIDRGDWIPSEAKTLSAFLDTWLKESVKPDTRSSTYAFYDSNSKRLKICLGEIQLDKLTPLQIQAHLNKERERGIKPTSVRAQFTTLNVAMKKAVKWKRIAQNPCDGVDVPKKNKPKRQAVSPEDAKRIIALFPLGFVIHTAIILGLSLGLRRGEICGLRWSDIDMGNKSAFIRHSLDRMDKEEAERLLKEGEIVWYGRESKKGTSVLALGPVKTDESEAKIALPENLIPFLNGLLLSQKKDRLKLGKAYHKNDFVLCDESGDPIDPDYVYHRFTKTIKQHNEAIDKEIEAAQKESRPAKKSEADKVPLIRIHDLRHTHATTLLYSGISVKAASRQLRHASASFTQDTYQHIIEEVQRDPAAAIDKVFGGWGENVGEEKKKEPKV